LTPRSKPRYFRNNVIDRARYFFTPRVGHNAESTVLAAAFHNRDKCRRTVHAGFWQSIKFFNFREADVDDYGLTLSAVFDHFGQPMQCLWAKDEIHKRCALSDLGTFLTGDTPPDADDDSGILLLESLPASQLVEYLFLGFLSNRAGIEQQHICILWRGRHHQSMAFAQQIRHARRVILVHLASMGFYKQFFTVGVGHALLSAYA